MVSPFLLFVFSLLFFHTSEFILAAIYNPDLLEWSCTLSMSHPICIQKQNFNNDLQLWLLFAAWLFSRPYAFAMAIASIEYWLEVTVAPWIKMQWISYIGLILIFVGEVLRKVGIITAGQNFTQRVQVERRPHHQLVTHGIYSYMRHPGYAGWVLWAIGTQFLLCNPICIVLFAFLVSQNLALFVTEV